MQLVSKLEVFLKFNKYFISIESLKDIIKIRFIYRQLYSNIESRKSYFFLFILALFLLVVLLKNFILFIFIWYEFCNCYFCYINLCRCGYYRFF